MYETARNTARRYLMLEPGDIVVVGVSGGADSMALLNFLIKYGKEINFSLKAVHVNHHIRDSAAEEDAAFVKQYCEAFGIDIALYDYNILEYAQTAKITTEEAGRQKRYEAFEKEAILLNANKIAIAHNSGDNVETILMNILRGSGMAGAVGIPKRRGIIIRPLIECTRQQIEHYCIANNIPFVNDATNNENIYTRNKLRNIVLPYITKEINKEAHNAILQFAKIMEMENDYMDSSARMSYNDCLISASNASVTLSCSKLKALNKAISYRVIREAVKHVDSSLKDVSYSNIEDIYSLLEKQTGKSVKISNGRIVSRSYDNLFFSKSKESASGFCYQICVGDFVYAPEINMYVSLTKEKLKINFPNVCTKVFNYDKIGDYIWLRTRRPGDRIYIKNTGSKKLKDFFIDNKVPVDIRDTIPLIANDEEIIWIVDMRTSYKFAAGGTSNIVYVQFWEVKNNERNDNRASF